MRRPSLTRCPAPYASPGGHHQCIQRRPCSAHPQRRWSVLWPLLALVWAIRPWWPSHLGRAQDAGHAHTPNVQPCRACTLEHQQMDREHAHADHYDTYAARGGIRRRHRTASYVPARGHPDSGTGPIVFWHADPDWLNPDGSITPGTEHVVRSYRCTHHDR